MTNTNANENKEIKTTFEAAAQGVDARFYEDIQDYSKADGDLKVRMDALIASIDAKNLNTITSFGKEPTDVLRESAEAIVKRAQNATTFMGGFAKIKEQLANFDFSTVGKLAKDYVDQVDRKLALAKYSPIVRWFKKLFTGKKETSMDSIRHEVNKSLLQLGDVVANLEESKKEIPQVNADLQTLENARFEAYTEYGVYIGAALEKYRQVKEEVKLLEAEQSTSPIKQNELRNLRLSATVLNTKLTDMDSFHKTCLLQLKTIDDLQEALAMTELKIDSHLTISQGQWTALLAEASTASQIAELAENVKAADDFGDKIFEQSQKLSDMTKEMARAAFGHGTLDPVKVVAHLEKRTKEIQEDMIYIENYNRKMEEHRTKLDEAGKNFRDAAAKVTTTSVAQLTEGATAANTNTLKK